MKDLNESLLHAWLRLSSSIINSRVVSDLSFAETQVCNVLYTTFIETPEKLLTATDLCHATKMLKSQMNRTLKALESKNIITRERSSNDKRQIFIKFNVNSADIYLKQHEKILHLTDSIINLLGEEKTKDAIQIFTTFSEVADRVLNNIHLDNNENNLIERG